MGFYPVKSVHPGGKPIKASTHVGFKLPLFSPNAAWSDSGLELRSKVVCEQRPERQSRALGVGHRRCDTASVKVPPSRPLRGVTRPPWLPSVALGVGQ